MATLESTRTGSGRGQAIVELALTLPLLLLIVLGIFDFGLMFQRYEVVTNAAREGARVGVLPDYSLADARTRALAYLTASGLNVATRSAPCGGTLAPNTRCAHAEPSTTTIPGTPAKTVNQVTVIVEYDHQHVFVGPIMELFGGAMGTTRLRAVSSMRVE